MNEAHSSDLSSPCQRVKSRFLFVCRQFQQIADFIVNSLRNYTAKCAARRRRSGLEQNGVVQTKRPPTAFIGIQTRCTVGWAIQPRRALAPGGGVVFVQQVLHAEADFTHRQGVAAQEVDRVIAIDLLAVGVRDVKGLRALHAQGPVARRPVDPRAGFRRAGAVYRQLLPFPVFASFRLNGVKVRARAPVAVGEEIVHLTFHPVDTTLVVFQLDGHVRLVDGDGFIRERVIRRNLGAQVIPGVAPAQLISVDLDTVQLRVVDVDTVQQAIVTVAELIGPGAVVLRQVRNFEALGKVKPQLLLFGQPTEDPGVKQEVVVIGFPARHRVGGGSFPGSDGLLLGETTKSSTLFSVYW